MKPETIGIIGYGNMGSAIVGGLVKTPGIMPSDIHVFDIDREKTDSAHKDGYFVNSSVTELGEAARLVIIAAKPKDVPAILAELRGIYTIETVLSIAAGISIDSMEEILGETPVVRAMPNAPCMIGAGAIAISGGTYALVEHIEKVKTLLSSVGVVVEVPESLMDAVTGLSGSGPAFVAVMIEALSDGGVKMGLPRQTALMLAAQTVFGTAKMILKNNIHPAKLRDMVSSPAGTTIEGIAALENGAFRGTVINAVEAAALRSQELGG
jgi:pyrroline-5-carboxylate reductase